MAAGPPERRDARVRCCSRRGLDEVVGLCAPFLRGLAQGQPGGAAATDDAIWVRHREPRGAVGADRYGWVCRVGQSASGIAWGGEAERHGGRGCRCKNGTRCPERARGEHRSW